MTTKTLDLNNIERKIFWILTSMVAIISVFYLYSAASITIAVVDRNNMNRSALELSNKAGQLESEYFRLTNSVTLPFAQNLGFHEVSTRYAEENNSKISMNR